MSELHLFNTKVLYYIGWIIYLQPWWHYWLQNKKGGWLLHWPAMVVIGCWGLFLGHILCVPVYSMCMLATVVYIHLRLYYNIWMWSALRRHNSTSQCVRLQGDGGLYLFYSQESFHGEWWDLEFSEGTGMWCWLSRCFRVCGQCAVLMQARAEGEVWTGCYLMIWGQSLQALAFRLARASQAGSVDTCGESPEGKRFDTSLTAGGEGVESAISTETTNR